MNVKEIKVAIKKLYDDINLREKMARGASVKASKMNLENRAKNIIEYMQKMI